MLGAYEFLPSTKFMGMIGSALCHDHSIVQDMCSNILFLIAGFDSVQLNKVRSFLETYIKHFFL